MSIGQTARKPIDKTVFSAGRGPGHWRRSLECSVTQVAEIRRVTRWIEANTLAPPKLCQEPLLGRSLSALTKSEVAHPPETLPELSPPKTSKAPIPETSLKHDREHCPVEEKTKPPAAQRSRRETALPHRLAPSVSRSHLEKLAGSDAAPKGSDQPQRCVPEPPAKPKLKTAPPAAPDPVKEQEWLQRRVRRVECDLAPKKGAPSRDHPPRPSPTKPPGPPQDAPLIEQWAKPLQGETAPPDLLTRLVSQVVEKPDQVEQESAVKTSSPVPAQTVGGTDPTFRQPAVGSAVATRELVTNKPDTMVRGEDSPGSIKRPSTVTAPEVNGGKREGHALLDRPERIAPPLDATTLPILDATPDVIEPPPMSPLKAVFNRRETDAAKETAGEDHLQLLSAKIKRILDEEARRYGIDV
jgi:hypothetical protein